MPKHLGTNRLVPHIVAIHFSTLNCSPALEKDPTQNSSIPKGRLSGGDNKTRSSAYAIAPAKCLQCGILKLNPLTHQVHRPSAH